MSQAGTPRSEGVEPEEHPCDRAWRRLADVNDALEGARSADSATGYRVLLLTAYLRAQVYAEALEALLTELGE